MCTIKKKNHMGVWGIPGRKKSEKGPSQVCEGASGRGWWGAGGASDPCSFGNEQRLQVRAEGPVGSTILHPQSCCSWWCAGSSGTAVSTGGLDKPASRRWVVGRARTAHGCRGTSWTSEGGGCRGPGSTGCMSETTV